MVEPFVAEIRIFAGNFAPRGWAVCGGQLLPIQQNTALFSLLGTVYGGNGRSNFGLPDLRGRVPIQQGQGAGLSERILGEIGGSESVTLLQTEMPNHSHTPKVALNNGNSTTPVNTVWAPSAFGRQRNLNYSSAAANGQLNPQSIGSTGGGQPHNNMPPYLTLTYIIALQGIFPPRPDQ